MRYRHKNRQKKKARRKEKERKRKEKRNKQLRKNIYLMKYDCSILENIIDNNDHSSLEHLTQAKN